MKLHDQINKILDSYVSDYHRLHNFECYIARLSYFLIIPLLLLEITWFHWVTPPHLAGPLFIILFVVFWFSFWLGNFISAAFSLHLKEVAGNLALLATRLDKFEEQLDSFVTDRTKGDKN